MVEEATLTVAGRNYIIPQAVIRHIQALPDKRRRAIAYGPAGARLLNGVEQPRYGFTVSEVRENETVDIIKQSALFFSQQDAQKAGDELLGKIVRLALA